MSRYVIIGGGVAGVTAARYLAQEASSDDEIHIFSAEPYSYYPRPLLWKLIAGQLEQEQLFPQPISWYEEKGIRFHVDTRVAAVDPDAHHVILEDGSTRPYDRLLLATGARPFVPPCRGTDKEGVFTLRTLKDALAIKSYVEGVSKAILIGGGLLGLETARALRDAGPEVLVIEIADHLLPRQLDAEGAEVLRSLLEERGLQLITGAVVEAVLGGERAGGVRTEDGREMDGGLVLFSAGIRCRAKLAEEAGLKVNRGAVVDEEMRTSAEDVFAAGDLAEFEGQIYGIIPPAMEQANVAASNMIEPGSATYSGTLPSTTLKVVGAQVTSLGAYGGDEREGLEAVRYADAEAGVYRKFVLRDGRVVGFILLNDQPRAAMARQLIEREIDVSGHVDRLVHDDFDLKSLL